MVFIQRDGIDEVQPLLTRFGIRLELKRGVTQYNNFFFVLF